MPLSVIGAAESSVFQGTQPLQSGHLDVDSAAAQHGRNTCHGHAGQPLHGMHRMCSAPQTAGSTLARPSEGHLEKSSFPDFLTKAAQTGT